MHLAPLVHAVNPMYEEPSNPSVTPGHTAGHTAPGHLKNTPDSQKQVQRRNGPSVPLWAWATVGAACLLLLIYLVGR